MGNKRTYKKIGTFTLSQPKMFVSDPCYPIGTWCTKLVNNCKIGKWTASININNYPYAYKGVKSDDFRVATLFVRHESLKANTIFNGIHWSDDGIRYVSDWENLSDDIGVDSGQAGFFDYAKYGDNSLFEKVGKCGIGDNWYSNCCDQTLKKHAGIVADMGVNSSSGFGDGCYTVWGHCDDAGNFDALVLFFLPDN